MDKRLLLIGWILCLLNFSDLQAQVNFYKQFKGKIGTQDIRAELIKAPSKDNAQFNLRGSYSFERTGETIKLNQGNIDLLGNIYLEEGVNKQDYNGQFTFAKTGILKGVYYPNTSRIEGSWYGVSGQSMPFFLQEDYSNHSIAAEIVFNDVHYEDAEIRFHYPRFENHPQAANINQFLQKNILGDMPAKMVEFINNYQEQAALGGMTDGFESINIAYIRHNDQHLLCLEYATNEFQGGMHGIYQSTYYNFNLQTGAQITLEELFIKDFENALTEKAEQIFRNNFGIKSNQSLGEFGFTFPGNTFKLNRNFYVTKTGIGFYYNVYEIAPYAVGALEVFIPYSAIHSLIKKNGLLGAYIR